MENNNIKKSKSKTSTRTKKRKFRVVNIFKIFLVMFLVGAIVVAGIGTVVVAEVIKDTPKGNKDSFKLKEQTVLYDKELNQMAAIGAQQKLLKYEEIPEVFVAALLSIEDSRFFSHDGVDKPRLLVASLKGGSAGGASTLTMQSIKNAITLKGEEENSTQAKVKRKIQDIYLSMEIIEKNYTKEEIFEFYVNSLYLGNYSNGLEAASHSYFNKNASDLNLAEASFLAGMYQAPGDYDPTRKTTAPAQRRRDNVLDLMAYHGYISQEQAENTKEIPLQSYLNTSNRLNSVGPEYSDYVNTVVAEIKKDTGLDPYQIPMKIYTNMQPAVQLNMYNVKMGDYWPNEKLQTAATTIDNSDGTVAGVLTGREVDETGYNFATALQQPGSTAKPFMDYAPCFEQGNCQSIYETIADEPTKYSNGAPINNWDNGYKGTMTLTSALNTSRNIPALKLFQRNDPAKTVEMGKKMGLNMGLDSNGALFEASSIGGYTGESTMTSASAYSTFARGGTHQKATTYNKLIINYDREDEQIIDNVQPVETILKPTSADAINQMLWSQQPGSFGSHMSGYGVNFSVKTGTSNWSKEYLASVGASNNYNTASRDHWEVVYSPEYTTSIWTGYDKLTAEYVQNGWVTPYNINSIKHRLSIALTTGPAQPRYNGANFPAWRTVNSASIEVELADDRKDDDSDGVPNANDTCPNTPAGTAVDGAGCPLPVVVPPPKPVVPDPDPEPIDPNPVP